MCTALLSVEPGLPVLLVGVRDELIDRAWEPPARHWRDRPEVIGGRDLQAGGTWLAVSPADRRVACVLNGRGQLAPAASRLSRGVLPLDAASGRSIDKDSLANTDPFHLITARPGGALWQSWDGEVLTERDLGPGLHLAVNSGLAADLFPPPARPDHDSAAPGAHVAENGHADELARVAENGHAHELARVAYFLPRLEAAARPDPKPGQPSQPQQAGQSGQPGQPGQPDRPTPTPTAWGEWFSLVNGDGLSSSDDRALIVRRDLGGGRIWGTTSISLVALSPAGLRYDFSGRPGDPASWRTIDLS